MNWRTDFDNAFIDGRKVFLCNNKNEVVVATWENTVHHDFPNQPPVYNWVIGNTFGSKVIFANPTHWAEIELPGQQPEAERLAHDFSMFRKYCMLSATYLMEKSEKYNKVHQDESDQYFKDAGEYIRIATWVGNILDNECLRYKEVTKEHVYQLWDSFHGRNMFSEIPPEYKKDFYKKK